MCNISKWPNYILNLWSIILTFLQYQSILYFDEQLDIFKLTFGDTHNFHSVSASDNPPILSGEIGHGGVALLWNLSLDDFIKPLRKIESDRIVGIKCSFPGVSPFFVLSIHLPSVYHLAEEFQEYFDYLWALYESLSVQGYTILGRF